MMGGKANSAPRICVLGAGAVGTLVAARLLAAGQRITVVARGERLRDIAASGLRLRDSRGAVSRFEVKARNAAEAGEHDVVLLALKGKDIPAALPDLLGLIGPDTRIVPLVNGIPWWYRQPASREAVEAVDPQGALAATLDPHRIVGAVLFLTSTLADDGVVDVLGPARIVLGPVVEGDMAALEPLPALFHGCAIETRFVPDVRRDLWAKVALNLATNPLSVVAGATLEEQFHSDALPAVVTAVLEEAGALARALGVEPRFSVPEMVAIGRRAGPFYTSMAQDYRRGAPLELGAICLSVFELAERAAVAMPVARAVHELCRFKAGRKES